MQYDLAILLVRGFTKPSWGRRGIPAYYRKLRKEVGPSTFLKMYDWNSVNEIVRDILWHRPLSTIVRAHSYGVSTTCFAAARLYDEWPEFTIDNLLSLDGVARDDPYHVDIDSLKPGMLIDAPGNIKFINAKRQEDPDCIINGHQFRILEPDKTTLVEEVVEGVDHWNFDWQIEKWA